MKFNENIAYATLPKELRGRRNVANSEPRKGSARFRSGKSTMDEVCFLVYIWHHLPELG